MKTKISMRNLAGPKDVAIRVFDTEKSEHGSAVETEGFIVMLGMGDSAVFEVGEGQSLEIEEAQN